MSANSIANKALEQGKGILRLAPNWVPSSFCEPGRRIKLHPDDYYALGGERGGIDERWFASTTPADNGPLTSPNEGLSFIVFEDNGKTEKVLLKDAIDELKGQIIGDRLWNEHKRWPMYSKFFDNKGALPHNIHHIDEQAIFNDQLGKPKAYYFPSQVNDLNRHCYYVLLVCEPDTKLLAKDTNCVSRKCKNKGTPKKTSIKHKQFISKKNVSSHEISKTQIDASKPKKNKTKINIKQNKRKEPKLKIIQIQRTKTTTFTVKLGPRLVDLIEKQRWPFKILFEKFLHKDSIN